MPYVPDVSTVLVACFAQLANTAIDTATPMVEELMRNSEIRQDLMALHPFRGVGIPDDIARAALFLASEDASWLSGVSRHLWRDLRQSNETDSLPGHHSR